jgi:transcriptional regulator with XRE-family HTH domain
MGRQETVAQASPTGLIGKARQPARGHPMDQVAFARFVRGAVDTAKTQRGWTVTRLAAETGVGRSTLFRWLSGDCQEFPELAKVRGFCWALDIPVTAAFTALGVREGAGRDAIDAPPTDVEAEARADMQRILRRLIDPTVPRAQKAVIRDMLRYLAGGVTAEAG